MRIASRVQTNPADEGKPSPGRLEFGAALERLAQARTSAQSDVRQVPEFLVQLVDTAENLQRQGGFPEVESLLREAMQRLEEMPEPSAELALKVHSALAFFAGSRGDFALACHYYESALDCASRAEELESDLGARLCWNYAALSQHLGNEATAREYSERARRILLLNASAPGDELESAWSGEGDRMPAARRSVAFRLSERIVPGDGISALAQEAEAEISPAHPERIWSVEKHRPELPETALPHEGETARRTRPALAGIVLPPALH